MTARRTPSVLNALQTALKASPPPDCDAATVALAKRYALELDDSSVISTAAQKALRDLMQVEEIDDEVFEKFEALAARIEETHVAALIGPKFLAVLEQLNLTPKARNAVLTPGGGGGGDGGATPLGHLRALGSNRAKAVDSPAS